MRTIGSAQPSGGALPSSVCDEHRPDRQLLVDLQLVTGAMAVVGGILLAAARWVVARSQFRIGLRDDQRGSEQRPGDPLNVPQSGRLCMGRSHEISCAIQRRR